MEILVKVVYGINSYKFIKSHSFFNVERIPEKTRPDSPPLLYRVSRTHYTDILNKIIMSVVSLESL